MQFTAVKPYQKGCLWAQRMNAWNMLPAIVFHKANVFLDISQHLPTPLLSLAEGSYRGDMGKDMCLIQFIGLEPAKEAVTQFFVGHNGVTGDDASDIECLRGRLKRNADVSSLLRHAGKRYMAVSEECHITMNLVRDDQQVMIIAEVS